MLIGTFHNPNWVRAHILPVLQANDGNVLLVCDEPVEEFDGLETIYPPRLACKLLSRAVAKLFWGLAAAIKYRPDIVMGYHIFPAAVTAMIVGRTTNAQVGYQVTAGQLELEGGGWHAENVVLTMLGHASHIVERSAIGLVRQFDQVIVRGSRAEEFLRSNSVRCPVTAITGSVPIPDTCADRDARKNDIIFVGRLTEYKRPDRLIDVLAKVHDREVPFNAVLVGDGPDLTGLQERAEAAGITSQVEWAGQRSDIPELLQNARIFVLTSRWEGVSIALLEAMVSGLVPVVSNVGDMADVVQNAENGFIFEEDDLDAYADAIIRLLQDGEHWKKLSAKARESGTAKAGRDQVAAKWRTLFDECRRGCR